MRTFIADIIPQLQQFSKKLDDLTALTNSHWVSLRDIGQSKVVYIFRTDNTLLISEQGVVSRGSWEYLGNNALLFETNNQTLLLKQGFIDEHVMALKLDGSNGYLFLINETKYDNEINTIEDVQKFLEQKYARNTVAPNAHINLDLREIPQYKESLPTKSFDLVYGNHDKIKIFFSDGITAEIFKGHSTNKYFFHHLVWGKKYCDSKSDCIQNLYYHKRYKE